MKVGFGDCWKDSLSELSGGQRSLLALSLILGLLSRSLSLSLALSLSLSRWGSALAAVALAHAMCLCVGLLLFKPAPMYILDEIDAALDLSHTQNIGLDIYI